MKKILLAILLIYGCIGPVMTQREAIGGNTSLPDKVQKSLVFRDSAKSIEIITGQEFAIELDANATTGYQWQLAKPLNKRIIELLSTEYRVSETGLVGAGGKEVWKFRAVNQGKTMISMKYIRPWEKDVPPEKNVQFRVVIRH
jgi:inhibitor of cysteine peptidase